MDRQGTGRLPEELRWDRLKNVRVTGHVSADAVVEGGDVCGNFDLWNGTSSSSSDDSVTILRFLGCRVAM